MDGKVIIEKLAWHEQEQRNASPPPLFSAGVHLLNKPPLPPLDNQSCAAIPKVHFSSSLSSLSSLFSTASSLSSTSAFDGSSSSSSVADSGTGG